MTVNSRCSELSSRQNGQLIVLEGMPGAGKTTVAELLAAENRAVVGEYTTSDGATVALDHHPTVGDDVAHQHNWLIKHHQVQAARHRGPVFCDRDWLSSLAYAASLADDGGVLAERSKWVLDCLTRGALTIGDVYVVFRLDPAISLQRRHHRLTPGHPWSNLQSLMRLAAFYAAPVEAVESACPELAVLLGNATWHYLPHLPRLPLEGAARFLRELADRP